MGEHRAACAVARIIAVRDRGHTYLRRGAVAFGASHLDAQRPAFKMA